MSKDNWIKRLWQKVTPANSKRGKMMTEQNRKRAIEELKKKKKKNK